MLALFVWMSMNTNLPVGVIGVPKGGIDDLALNYKNQKIAVASARGGTILPHFWTPFHDYIKRVQGCEDCPQLHKWEPYFKAYHTHLSRFRGKSITMVEVGVQSGGSAMMWKSYFGPGLRYYGIDINPQAQQFQSDWATIFIGDQADPAFWDSLRGKLPKEVDFFLDDGGHTMEQQKVTFQKAFPLVKLNGVYACEDLSTSYSPFFGGEHLEAGALSGPKGSFIELAKQMIDWMNCYFAGGNVMNKWQGECSSEFHKGIMGTNGFLDSAYSLHFYSQILLIEKAQVLSPVPLKGGGYKFGYGGPDTFWDGKLYKTPSLSTKPLPL